MTKALPEQHVELMQAVALGDRNAFEQLYRQTSPRLFAVALRLLRRQSWAEEVLHESFISVWNRAASYDPNLSSPLTWLTHIVRNKAIDWLRGAGGRAGQTEEEWLDDLGASAEEPVSQLLLGEEAEKLAECLNHLNVEQRQSIVLAYYQGMSHGEVSAHLQQLCGPMKSKGEYDSALAAEYALGTLRGPARLNFEQRIQRDPTLAALAARWQTLLAPLDLALTPVLPPERVWKKIQLSLPIEAVPRRKRWDYLGWALAAGLAALLLVPRFITQPQDFAPAVVLNAGQQGSGQWIVSMDSGKRHLRLTPLNPQTLAVANSLQLWAISPGEKPRSLGLVAAEKPTELAVNSMTLAQGMTIAISLEPAGGSPTGLPTGPVLYSGQLTSL